MHHWIRVVANMLITPDIATALPTEIVTEMLYTAINRQRVVTFRELLKIGFRDRIINTLNHPVLKRLRGEC